MYLSMKESNRNFSDSTMYEDDFEMNEDCVDKKPAEGCITSEKIPFQIPHLIVESRSLGELRAAAPSSSSKAKRKSKSVASWIQKGFWTFGENIGKGSFGSVFQCMNDKGKLFAVKRIEMVSGRKDTVDDLLREIDLMRGLRHPNIVEYIGASVDERLGLVYIFQEWVSGGSVAHLLKLFGPFKEGAILRYTRQILQGLAYLHDHNIVHRDIKGGNVLVDESGTVKLADFGASTKVGMAGTQEIKDIKGTPYFMAPEVLGNSRYGRKGDIWAVGCTMIQMLTGEPPWKDRQLQGLVQLHMVLASWPGGPPPMPTLTHQPGGDMMSLLDLCFRKDMQARPAAADLLRLPMFNTRDEDDETITGTLTTSSNCYHKENTGVHFFGSSPNVQNDRQGQDVNSPSSNSRSTDFEEDGSLENSADVMMILKEKMTRAMSIVDTMGSRPSSTNPVNLSQCASPMRAHPSPVHSHNRSHSQSQSRQSVSRPPSSSSNHTSFGPIEDQLVVPPMLLPASPWSRNNPFARSRSGSGLGIGAATSISSTGSAAPSPVPAGPRDALSVPQTFSPHAMFPIFRTFSDEDNSPCKASQQIHVQQQHQGFWNTSGRSPTRQQQQHFTIAEGEDEDGSDHSFGGVNAESAQTSTHSSSKSNDRYNGPSSKMHLNKSTVDSLTSRSAMRGSSKLMPLDNPLLMPESASHKTVLKSRQGLSVKLHPLQVPNGGSSDSYDSPHDYDRDEPPTTERSRSPATSNSNSSGQSISSHPKLPSSKQQHSRGRSRLGLSVNTSYTYEPQLQPLVQLRTLPKSAPASLTSQHSSSASTHCSSTPVLPAIKGAIKLEEPSGSLSQKPRILSSISSHLGVSHSYSSAAIGTQSKWSCLKCGHKNENLHHCDRCATVRGATGSRANESKISIRT